MTRRWKFRPSGSNWGDFGADDQIGRLNLITPEKVLEGIAEVKVGKSFCLSLPLDYPGGNAVNPKRYPPLLRPTLHEDKQPYYNLVWGDYKPGLNDVSYDDTVLLHTQYSTQWDSLAHAGAKLDVHGDGHEEVLLVTSRDRQRRAVLEVQIAVFASGYVVPVTGVPREAVRRRRSRRCRTVQDHVLIPTLPVLRTGWRCPSRAGEQRLENVGVGTRSRRCCRSGIDILR